MIYHLLGDTRKLLLNFIKIIEMKFYNFSNYKIITDMIWNVSSMEKMINETKFLNDTYSYRPIASLEWCFV